MRHARALQLLHRLLRAEVVMDDLDRADFLHCPVGRGAVGTVDDLPRGGVDGFDKSKTLHIL